MNSSDVSATGDHEESSNKDKRPSSDSIARTEAPKKFRLAEEVLVAPDLTVTQHQTRASDPKTMKRVRFGDLVVALAHGIKDLEEVIDQVQDIRNSFKMSLSEHYINIEDRIDVAEFWTEAQIKLNTVKSLKLSLASLKKQLNTSGRTAPASAVDDNASMGIDAVALDEFTDPSFLRPDNAAISTSNTMTTADSSYFPPNNDPNTSGLDHPVIFTETYVQGTPSYTYTVDQQHSHSYATQQNPSIQYTPYIVEQPQMVELPPPHPSN